MTKTYVLPKETSLFEPVTVQHYTRLAPTTVQGVKELYVKSPQPFAVLINGRQRQQVKALRVYHNEPLTLEGIAGMSDIVYSGTTATEPDSATLVPERNGRLTVSGYKTVPELELLSSPETMGKEELRRDPRLVIMDGVPYKNLDYLEISGLPREAEVKVNF